MSSLPDEARRRPEVRNPALLWAFAPALLTFLIVGRLAGTRGHFGWDPAAISATGVATATLAYFTATLARSTSVDVAATRELADIERRRFAKEDEPFVVEGARRVGNGMAGVDIVNVGRGPAVNILWEAYFRMEPGGGEFLPQEKPKGDAGALVGGARTDAAFSAWHQEAEGRYGLRGTYADRDSKQLYHFGPDPIGGWDAWLAERANDAWWRTAGTYVRPFA